MEERRLFVEQHGNPLREQVDADVCSITQHVGARDARADFEEHQFAIVMEQFQVKRRAAQSERAQAEIGEGLAAAREAGEVAEDERAECAPDSKARQFEMYWLTLANAISPLSITMPSTCRTSPSTNSSISWPDNA